jgi:hypothetical protein
LKKWTAPPAAKKSKPRKPKIDWEGNEQTVFFRWLQLQHPSVFNMAYHTPNGGHRSKSEGARLKKQGVKAGVPDVCIAIAKGGYFGLYIEFKATPPKDSAVSVSQGEWLAKLSAQGYKAVLCKGLDSIMAEVSDYLKLPATAVEKD